MPSPALTGRALPQTGFTLIELMVTIVIVSILLTLAVPSFTNFIRTTRLRNATFDLLTDLNFARSEAIKGNSEVTLCRSANSTAALPSCGGSGNYSAGWIVFRDLDGDGTLDNGETVLRTHAAIPNLTIPTTNTLASNASFQTRGLANPWGTFSLCFSSGEAIQRQIVVSSLGQIRLNESPSGTCP